MHYLAIIMKKLLITILFISFYTTLQSQDFSLVDEAINTSIQDSVFPGGTFLVGNEEGLIYKNAYGNFTYETSSPKVENNTIFDLASVTKAFGTTFCVMKLVDDKKLDINKPVAYYLPEFAANGKENVRVVDLLIHESGLQPYYTPQENECRTHIVDTIKSLNLSYETGLNTKYSCLNLVTTMMVVESIIDEPMYKFYAENFTTPLEMERTFFTPNDEMKKLCIPTSKELQGVVHDPLARGLEGLSGNAGLYSTIEDLSKLCQILLNKGTYKGKRYLSEEVITNFSKQYSPQSDRAIGFDTKGAAGENSLSGLYTSKKTFGHLGYTGTSIWIDPVNKVYFVFLTNRVYPDDTAHVNGTRRKVHTNAMISLGLD